MADEFTMTARWVFPVTSAPLEGGLVTVRDDRIVGVESRGARTADIDLGNVALTPGFVNAHTHLDLTGAAGKTPPTSDFIGWLRQIIDYRRNQTPEKTTADVRAGIAECIRHGTTLIGDIAANGQSWDALAEAPLRAVVYFEVIGLTDVRSRESVASAWQWCLDRADDASIRRGISPHAPYSFNRWAMDRLPGSRPFAIHLAETLAEIEVLEYRSGQFVPFLKELGAWDEDGLANRIDQVIDMMARHNSPVLYIHGNYLSPTVSIPPHCSVVYCPRTHAAFGHPPHPFRDFHSRGIRVALGTDSLASNPDLSVLAEARFVRSRYPQVPGDLLLRMATSSGARALGWNGETGKLLSGKSADFAVVALPDREAIEPHELLFDSDLPVVATWFRGREAYRSPSDRR
jgi:cytosine/adenosine deaminase-related metal-dependent hydrolase